jgi:hypothetical protein
MSTKVRENAESSSHEGVAGQLDKDIHEAVAQLVGYADSAHEEPLLRFVLLCTARAQLENEETVGADPELQWVKLAKDAYEQAANNKPASEGHYPLPVLLSERPTAISSQRELYQKMAANLLIANTDEAANIHPGADFANQVAVGTIQIRYT